MEKESVIHLAERYPKGTVHLARVQSLKPYGAFLTLEDGTPGIVRNRDLSWDKEIEHPNELLSLGQSITVLVLGVDGHHLPPRLELSLRQAQHDPWSTVSHRYHTCQTVRSKVCGLIRSGAFVELEPSVTGFIPIREIGITPPDEVDQVLWIGDTVDAEITRIDLNQRQIDLSLRQHLMKLERRREETFQREYLESDHSLSVSIGELLSPEQRLSLLQFFKDRHPSSHQHQNFNNHSTSTLVERFPRILVVDDDPSFRHSMQRLLIRLGHEVDICENAEKALTMCTEKQFSLVLMDFEFRSGNLDGIEATRRLTDTHPNLPVLLVTGTNWPVNQRALGGQSRSSGARGLLTKPLDFARLQSTMSVVAEGNQEWSNSQNELQATDADPRRSFSIANNDLLLSINSELQRLLKITQAGSCSLFHLPPSSRRISVFAHQGAPLTGYDKAKYQLHASPIADVILGGKTIFESDVLRHQQKFQYLNILDFTSCLGLPVKGFGSCEYGLFLFHSEIAHFTKDHLKEAETTAHFLAALIGRKEAENVIQKMQPFTFAGQLGAHLVHELNNRLASILNDTEMLVLDTGLNGIGSSNAGSETLTSMHPLAQITDPNRFDLIRNCVLSLRQNSHAMRKITQLYLGIVGPEYIEPVNLNDVIQRSVKLLSPVAEGHGVKILTDLESNLPQTLAVSVRLEQACVNLMLNAIQNIYAAKGSGELMIKSRFTGNRSSLPLQLRFIDNGPGIHQQLCERIFDLGFTTRQNGGGLGLFITRGLIESMAGVITIEETVISVGTTFLIELPLVVPFVEGKFDE